jgi:hypothetical protein
MPSMTEAAVIRQDGATAASNHRSSGSPRLSARVETHLAAARALLEPGRRAFETRRHDNNSGDHLSGPHLSWDVPVDVLAPGESTVVVTPRLSQLSLAQSQVRAVSPSVPG